MKKDAGSPRSLLSSVATGSAQIPKDTALSSYTRLMLHSANSFGEQLTAQSLVVNDTEGTVSRAVFSDLDPDEGEIGGAISWTPPRDVSQALQVTYFFDRLNCSLPGVILPFAAWEKRLFCLFRLSFTPL